MVDNDGVQFLEELFVAVSCHDLEIMAGGISIELFLDRRAPERGESGIRVTLLSADFEIVFCGPGEVTGTSEGVSNNVSWTPLMN